MRKYKRKKKFKPNKVIPEGKLLEMIINSELRPYGITMKDVLNMPDWFMVYTFKSPSQELIWIEDIVRLYSRHYRPWYINKRKARRDLSMTILCYGLKSDYPIKLRKDI